MNIFKSFRVDNERSGRNSRVTMAAVKMAGMETQLLLIILLLLLLPFL